MHPSRLKLLRRHVPLLMFAALLAMTVALHRNLPHRLGYPPSSFDQEAMYLPAGEAFGQGFVFFERSPVYAAWVGTCYLLGGHDLQRAFYLDKMISVFLLSFLVACLGWNLFDARTGLLFGIWILNSKYFVLESNGSHAVSAIFFAASLLCFFVPKRELRVPAAIVMFFLSAKTRSEMLMPLFLCVSVWAVDTARRWRRNRRRPSRAAVLYAASALTLCIALSGLFAMRVFWPEPNRLREAFAMNFGMNYIDRYHQLYRFPQIGKAYPEIWAEVFPDVSPPPAEMRKDLSRIPVWGAIRSNPREIFAHVVYNVRLALRALPAMLLAFDRPILMSLVLVAYVGSYAPNKFRHFGLEKWHALPVETRRHLVFWGASACLLIPISLILRVVARYFIQLLPGQIAVSVFLVRAIAEKLRSHSPAAESANK